MPQIPSPGDVLPASMTASAKPRFIYIACPWTPVGGGMFKVADYLIQSQGTPRAGESAALEPLDTRGAGSPARSMLVLAGALAKIARGRLSGRLAGVHVNMAERLSLFRKSVIVATCRALGLPVVLHLHAAQLHHAYRAFPAWKQGLVRWVFSLPSSVVVLGQVSADFVVQELRVPGERVDIVINGVPESRVPRRVPGPEKRVLFVGNLSERKGVSDLLQALAHPALAGLPMRTSFAGGGEVAAYQAKADSLGLGERVRFEGWSDQEKVARLLAQADVLVLPSYDEGLPLAILEALAQGVAVVCTPVGEIPHVLTNGRDACFVTPGDAADIANGLARVLRNTSLRETLEHNGRALYRRNFSLASFSGSIAAIHGRHFGIAGAPAPDKGAAETLA